MPFDRPTLPQIVDRIGADQESRLPGTDARLRRQALGVFARVLAGVAHGLHGHLAWLADQILPDTASAEILARHAAVWGVLRKAAAAATGQVIFAGQDGAVVPAGALLQRADGAEYATTGEAAISGAGAVVAVAAQQAGAAGNYAAGGLLSLVTPIPGVAGTATVATGGLGGGADTEGDDSLRQRLLARIQSPPHGGSAADYARWALEVPGVTRAWVYPGWLGIGTVGVAIVNDDTEEVVADQATVEACQEHIDAERPVTADVLVFAPVAVPLDLEVTVTPDTPSVRAAVEAELRDLLRREAVPGGTIYLSRINEAISLAAGEQDHVLISPVANVEHGPGEIAVFGEIAWV